MSDTPAILLVATFIAAGCGNSSSSNSQPPAPAGSPIAPSHLTAQLESGGGRLDWRDNSDDEDGFVIERRVGDGDWRNRDTIGPDTITYLDTTVGGSQITHRYRVRASNAFGLSQYSSEAAFETPEFTGASCALVIEGDLGSTDHHQDGDPGTSFWLLTDEAGSERVTAGARLPAGTAGSFAMDGGWLGTTWFEVKQNTAPRWQNWEIDMQFPRIGAEHDGLPGDLCLLLHDSGSGEPYAESPHRISSRAPHFATLLGGRVPIRPGDTYSIRVTVDPEQRTFDVWWGLLPIAAGVAFDDVLVVAAEYQHPR